MLFQFRTTLPNMTSPPDFSILKALKITPSKSPL